MTSSWIRCPRMLHRSVTTLGRNPAETAQSTVKDEGSIASVFASLSGEPASILPPRFSDLKKALFSEALIESWRQVLTELERAVAEIAQKGSEIIPRVQYSDLQHGQLSNNTVEEIKKVGTVIVQGGIRNQEAIGWKQSIQEYISCNRTQVKGFPPGNLQVFELYNSKPQTVARTHPAILNTQKFLLSLWHNSDSASKISLSTPISYHDRLRIRLPGDSQFALGPHIDGGSLERWEDPGFRSCWKRILEGGNAWRSHDPFDASPRLNAVQDLYNGPGQCSVFRPWQGWTALSETSPTEGTLRVFPRLKLATAYLILRPFFKPKRSASHLGFADWELDLDSTDFPGSAPGRGQELYPETHPHLHLKDTMTSIPKVYPGDQVYWHCDVVHSVEDTHAGRSDSSVFYIPAIPLTIRNANYLLLQRASFLAARPPPDFPGGVGESQMEGRATAEDVKGIEGRRAFGLEKFVSREASQVGESEVVKLANELLF